MGDPGDEMTDEQLEAALSAAGGVPPAGEAVPEPLPDPDPIPAQETEPVAEEAPAEPAKEPEADYETQQARLLREELEARAKHWESVAGRNAGKLGWLEGQIRAMQAAQAAQQVDDNGEQIERPPAPAPTRDGLAEWAVQQAVQQAVGAFEASHPDVQELSEKMTERIKASGYDLQSVLALNNPIEAQREISRALDEAYWHTKAEVTATRRAELTAKREAIQSQAAANKLKASVSATASVPPPKPRAKTSD